MGIYVDFIKSPTVFNVCTGPRGFDLFWCPCFVSSGFLASLNTPPESLCLAVISAVIGCHCVLVVCG